jgi:hypothetical protein
VVDNGNLPPLPGIYPDYPAPIVRNSAAGRELAMARWGMPTPPKFLEGRKSDPGVTNIRNPASPHWRGWLGGSATSMWPSRRPRRAVAASTAAIQSSSTMRWTGCSNRNPAS